MRITLEIDDAIVPSAQEYLRTQVRAENDPITKAQRFIPIYDSVEAWVADQVGTLFHQVLTQYPTPEIRAQLEQAKALQDKIKEQAKPKQVKA